MQGLLQNQTLTRALQGPVCLDCTEWSLCQPPSFVVHASSHRNMFFVPGCHTTLLICLCTRTHALVCLECHHKKAIPEMLPGATETDRLLLSFPVTSN